MLKSVWRGLKLSVLTLVGVHSAGESVLGLQKHLVLLHLWCLHLKLTSMMRLVLHSHPSPWVLPLILGDLCGLSLVVLEVDWSYLLVSIHLLQRLLHLHVLLLHTGLLVKLILRVRLVLM